MARDEKVMIRLTTDVKSELQIHAENYGMTMSSLGSFIIGKWLADQRGLKPLQDKMTETALSAVREQVGQKTEGLDEFMNEYMKEFMESMMKHQIKSEQAKAAGGSES